MKCRTNANADRRYLFVKTKHTDANASSSDKTLCLELRAKVKPLRGPLLPSKGLSLSSELEWTDSRINFLEMLKSLLALNTNGTIAARILN